MSTQRARRDELDSVLAHFGLDKEAPIDGRRSETVRLASALGALGPLAQAFLGELAVRADALTPEDRHALREARRRVEPLSAAAIERLVREEVSGLATELEIEPEVLSVNVLFQVQRGILSNGERVRVKVVRPEIERAVIEDIDTLDLVTRLRWIGADGRRVPLSTLADDFLQRLARWLDLRVEREGLEELAKRTALHVRVPRDFPHFLRRRVAVYEELDGIALNAPPATERSQRARCLVDLWLRLALREGLLWEDPSPLGVAEVAPDATSEAPHLVIEGGAFVAIDRGTRLALERYLLAAFRDEPDRALEALCEVLVASGGEDPGDLSDLRPQFRQLVPLREHGVPPGCVVARPFDQLPLQWRAFFHQVAVAGGVRLPEPLTAFQLGLAQVVGRAQHLIATTGTDGKQGVRETAGGSERMRSEVEGPRSNLADPFHTGDPARDHPLEDVLEDAVRRYRWRRAAATLLQAPSPRGWLGAMQRAAPALSQLLDRPRTSHRSSVDLGRGVRRRRSKSSIPRRIHADSWGRGLASLLLLAGLLLASDAWRRAGLPSRDALRIGAAAIALLAVLAAVVATVRWWRLRE